MFALGIALACAGEAEWKRNLDAGEAAYKRGDYATAATRFQVALQEAEATDPDGKRVASAASWLGFAYWEQQRLQEAEALFRRSLSIRERTLPPEDPDLARSYNPLGRMLRQQRRYAEAEPFFRKQLALREKTLGPENAMVAFSLTNIGEIYQEQGRYAEAEPVFRRALAIREKGLGPEHPEVAESLEALARIYEAEGRHGEMEPLLVRSLTIREKAFAPADARVAQSLNYLGWLYHLEGRYAEADPLLQRALVIREKALGPDNPAVANSCVNLGALRRMQGRYAEAEPLYRRAAAIFEKALGPQHPAFAGSLDALGGLYMVQGRDAEAEPLLRRALGIREASSGSESAGVASSLNSLAYLYGGQGRYPEAEPLFKRSIAVQEKSLGPEHPVLAITLNNLGGMYQIEGRYAEAEPLFRRAGAIMEKAYGSEHRGVGAYYNNIAVLYYRQGRYAEAEPLYLRALEIREKVLGPEHPDIVGSLLGLGRTYQAQAKYGQAEGLYKRSIAILEKAFGPEQPQLALPLNLLAGLYQAQGRVPEALAEARRATAILATRYQQREASDSRGALGEQRTAAPVFEQHVTLLRLDGEVNPGARAANAAEALSVAQLARASDTAEQLGRMAARFASGSDAIAKLARERQDLIARAQQIDTLIVQAAASATPNERDPAAKARLRAEGEQVAKSLVTLDARMAKDFPQYAELTSPRPVPLDELQKLLGADEALVAFLVTKEESFVWVVRRNRASFERISITRDELARVVAKLRLQLDLGAGDPAEILSRPFDAATAYDLYTKILAPGEALLAGAKHLIVVPDGALTSLPLAVLVTAKPGPDASAPAWLAKTYATTVLPSVGSLRALRAFTRAQPGREPFLGYGDPVLEGSSDTRGKIVAAIYSRGAVANTKEVKKLARLPETADELRSIAASLKAPPNSVKLRIDATERAVKGTDLAKYRTVAFATHGLVSGDFKGLAEPALVLTPPEQGSELDDGLLTAGEISQLKLNADWVILSACNTAAADGTPGADGLSGLAKAFFFAGARSLVVSHWSVSSDAAVALTTRMFEESAKGVPKAEALRRSMLALMGRTDRFYFAHPAVWAPFVVVGDGR